MPQIRRALISVTDKAGIVVFAKGLHQLGIEIISTGGTSKLLREALVPVRDVAEVTGFPEMLDGRVKTMHPKITGGILAVRSSAEHRAALEAHSIPEIDMVVVNLYRFQEAAAKPDIRIEDLVEQIDIGGPTMIRSAAKNFQDVAVITSPDDYEAVLAELKGNGSRLNQETCWRLARKAFRQTADYDAMIAATLESFGSERTELPQSLITREAKHADLRYGENPHQKAAVYGGSRGGIVGAKQIQGKELSYNNLVDLDAAWALINEFRAPAAAIIKHTNPAGCAENQSVADAYRKALECDPVSAFGGVVAVNQEVDEETAREMVKIFLEAIAAPGYSDAALRILRTKKNLRLLSVMPGESAAVVKSISGGFLVQTEDRHELVRAETQVVTKREPTNEEWQDLEFVWKVTKHVKSNAIVFARGGQTIGVGAGQMSRVDSVKLGASKAVLSLEGTVVGSDAFFPFADGLEEAIKSGATALIQPGGSIKDAEVIAAADALNAAMVFTGMRHFRH